MKNQIGFSGRECKYKLQFKLLQKSYLPGSKDSMDLVFEGLLEY
jgi:hypothetical protein